MQYIICEKCGWIHFSKPEKEMREHLEKFQKYINSLDEKTKKEKGYANFSVEKIIEKEKRCFRCGSDKLRLAKENERPPELSTIQAIIFEK